eukprot:jgi/Galph1/54/GphlegSOOS_G4886.1
MGIQKKRSLDTTARKQEENNFEHWDPEDETNVHWDNTLLEKEPENAVVFTQANTLAESESVTERPRKLRYRAPILLSEEKYSLAKVVGRDACSDKYSVENSAAKLKFEQEMPSPDWEFEDNATEHVEEKTKTDKETVYKGDEVERLASQFVEDVVRGKAIIRQQSIYTDILKLRMRLQRLLTITNCFPDPLGHGLLKELCLPTANNFSNIAVQLYGLTEKLVQLQTTLLGMGSSALLQNVGRSVGNSVEQEGQRSDQDTESLQDTEIGKSKSVEILWRELAERNKYLREFQNQVLVYWDKKVREASGRAYEHSGKFKVINQSVTKQIEGVLSNRARLLRRARTRRDSHVALVHSSFEDGVESEIYDDGDFFNLLLRESVDGSTIPTQSQTTWEHAVQSRQNRQKKSYLDRKQSKGRKLKYQVHDKLVGFITPVSLTEMSSTRDHLLRSLFGNYKG